MAQPDPFIGRDILNGQFQILQKIGSGGMGAVYKASQPQMNRMVGVKILHPKLANRKDLVSRFGREARAMSHLTHPNTVKVFMYGELDDGSLYIIMEFLEGKNLNQTVRGEGPFPVERALPVIIQVCGALEEAHRAGIIHRDLKPENIFLCQSAGMKDFPKVLDFGLAKVTEREMRPGSIILTQEGMVFGTPEFMSPEQAQGKTLTPASDQYSLAVILYEVLTGKLPFEAKSAMDFSRCTSPESRRRSRSASPERRFRRSSIRSSRAASRRRSKIASRRWRTSGWRSRRCSRDGASCRNRSRRAHPRGAGTPHQTPPRLRPRKARPARSRFLLRWASRTSPRRRAPTSRNRTPACSSAWPSRSCSSASCSRLSA